MKTRNVRLRQWIRYDYRRLAWIKANRGSYRPGAIKITPGQIRFFTARHRRMDRRRQ